ncbi:MAG TPA: protease pro-enzyme activation domain-containing protein, partial [Acidobacteriaceae bacterium]|nr:protease pro-enzyme activation domain-containing protein [Acidobacteriaceae bacterium]
MTSSKFRLLLPALLSLCLPVVAQSAQPANRIVAQIDDSNRIALQGNVHPMAQARFDRGPASLSLPTGRISLVLQPSAAQQRALTQYLADLQNPGSPNYHKWLTPAQYGAQFGISDSDLATVESWLQAQGFKVENVPAARNLIQFSGTFGQIQAAFHTSIHTFQVNGVSHFANTSDPQIPAALAPVVAGVAPLNDFRPKPGVVQGPRSHYDTAAHRIQPDLTLQDQNKNNYLVLVPADAATIYDAPNSALNTAYGGTKYDGTGVKLGIVGVSNIEMQDIVNYRTAFLGEASGSVNKPTVIVDGDDPGVQAGGSAVEALLDNEVAGGLAPGATIYFYTSADSDISSGLFNAIARAVNDNAVSILSVSFGSCEQGLGTSGNALINGLAEQASAQGISVTVSSGDGGSAGCDNFDTETAAQYGLAVSGFASTPYNIAVGGTDFDVLSTQMSTYVNTATYGSAPYYGTAKGTIPEATWNDSTTVNTTYSANVATKDSN